MFHISDDHQSIQKKRFSSHIVINLRKYRAFRRLIDMFTNISSIEQSKDDIATYLKVLKCIAYYTLIVYIFFA